MRKEEATSRVGSGEIRWELLAAVAVMGAAWTSGTDSLWRPELALLLALVLAGWLPFWRALSEVDWLTPLQAWSGWEQEAPLAPWPYVQPGTPGARLQRRLRQALAWWRACGRSTLASPLRAALSSLGLSLLLSLAAGRTALLLTFLFITLNEIALVWDGTGRMPPFFVALSGVGLPWLLGSTLGTGGAWGLLVALALSLLVAAFLQPGRAAGLALLPLLALLVVWQRSWAAGWVALAGLPLVWLSLWPLDPPAQWRRVEWWLLCLLVVTAGALA